MSELVSPDPLNHKTKLVQGAANAARVLRAKIKPTTWRSKRTAVHAAFVVLIATIVVQSRAMSGIDRSSLLYTLVSGEEVIEGPLDRSAYAQSGGAGIGGSRLAVADAGLNTEDITFDDPEVNFVPTSLGGNAVMAPLAPEAETLTTAAPSKSKEAQMYTVQDGDTIGGIADKFNISVATVLWANGLGSSDVIRPGDTLTILPVTGVQHTIKSGDTLIEIADKYKVKANEVAEYNGLDDNAKLSIGQKLIIPDGFIPPRSTPQIVPRAQLANLDADGPTPEPVKVAGANWAWPTITRGISQYFSGTRGHTGIDIPNRGANVPVYAANSGTVQFAGWLGGYGNLVIISHGNGMQTYYGHNKKNLVKEGQAVGKGAAIAIVGSTGRSTGPHVHFEIRRNGRPLNPLGFF